jgi:hypothetical protein
VKSLLETKFSNFRPNIQKNLNLGVDKASREEYNNKVISKGAVGNDSRSAFLVFAEHDL